MTLVTRTDLATTSAPKIIQQIKENIRNSIGEPLRVGDPQHVAQNMDTILEETRILLDSDLWQGVPLSVRIQVRLALQAIVMGQKSGPEPDARTNRIAGTFNSLFGEETPGILMGFASQNGMTVAEPYSAFQISYEPLGPIDYKPSFLTNSGYLKAIAERVLEILTSFKSNIGLANIKEIAETGLAFFQSDPEEETFVITGRLFYTNKFKLFDIQLKSIATLIKTALKYPERYPTIDREDLKTLKLFVYIFSLYSKITRVRMQFQDSSNYKKTDVQALAHMLDAKLSLFPRVKVPEFFPAIKSLGADAFPPIQRRFRREEAKQMWDNFNLELAKEVGEWSEDDKKSVNEAVIALKISMNIWRRINDSYDQPTQITLSPPSKYSHLVREMWRPNQQVRSAAAATSRMVASRFPRLTRAAAYLRRAAFRG